MRETKEREPVRVLPLHSLQSP